MKRTAITAAALSALAAGPAAAGSGEDETTLVVQAPDERYPYCATVDVAAARRAAKRRHPGLGSAYVAASGRAMEIMARAKWMRRLERLSVCTDERGLRALAKVRWTRLVDLEIASDDGAPLGAEEVGALAGSRGVRRVERLRFFAGDSEAERSLGPDGAVALAERARMPRLRALVLGWNPLDEASVAALVGSELAGQLEDLDLCQTAVAVDAVIAAGLTGLRRLCMSDLAGPDLDDAERARLDAAYPGVLSPSPYWLDEP